MSESEHVSAAPWRKLLAKWPIEWRERWGERANALEDEGHGWLEAERLAWNKTLAAKRAAEPGLAAPSTPPTIPLAPPAAQGLFRETA